MLLWLWGRFVLRLFCVLATLLFVAPYSTRAEASILVQIDRSVQRMSVSVDGMPRYNWRVSTARRGYITPPGTYHPQMLARRWFSRKYYNSPMPHAIFFYGGFAIHGTYEISQLGGPASHGCVRLDPANAATLFGLVEREGMGATTIVIHEVVGRRATEPRTECQQNSDRPGIPHTSTFSAAMKASCGMSTLPNWRMRFLPSFCFSRSLRLRVTSPP